MIRVSQGIDGYMEALKEIYRVLKPGGIFGVGEPMPLGVPVPEDLDPYVSQDEYSWKECFRSLDETTELIEKAGFGITESAYAPDAWDWWTAFARHDPFCKEDPDGDPKRLEVDGGRWTSFGYVVGKKDE